MHSTSLSGCYPKDANIKSLSLKGTCYCREQESEMELSVTALAQHVQAPQKEEDLIYLNYPSRIGHSLIQHTAHFT